MFFNNRQSSDTINVNTTVDTLFSDISSLTIGCWNNKISLRWMPAIGKDERGMTRYDKDNRISTSLSHMKIAALLKRYNKYLKPSIDEREDPGEKGKSIAVPLIGKEGNSALLIEYLRDENGKPAVYLTLAKKVTENGTDQENIIRYKFNSVSTMDDFNPTEGGGESVDEFSEFDDFIELLKSRKLMSSFSVHAGKYSAAFGGNKGQNSANTNSSASSGDFPDFAGPDGDFPFN